MFYDYNINRKRSRNIRIVDRSQFKSIDNTPIDNKERDTKQIIINYKNNDYILEDNILYELIKTKGKKYGTLINSKIEELNIYKLSI